MSNALRQHQFLLQFLDQLLLIGRFPRSLALDHLIQDNSQCKDISFVGVISLEYGLRRHIKRSSDIYAVFEAVLGLHCEPKVRNLPFVTFVSKIVSILRMLAGFRSLCMMFCPLR